MTNSTPAIDTAAAYIGQLAGRSEPVIVELFRLARLGALHEEQLPKPRPRTDGSLGVRHG